MHHPNKINVLHLSHHIDPYGVSAFLFHLILAESRQRDISINVALDEGEQRIARYRENGLGVHCLPKSSARNPRLFPYFLYLFKPFDIINLHTYSPWAVISAIVLRKKIVFTFHGAFGLRGRWTDPIKRGFYRFIVNPASRRMVFSSQTSLLAYQERIGCLLPKEKVAVFPFGLAVDSIRPNVSREETRSSLQVNNKFVIGTALRLDPAKKIERLIEALSYLSDKSGFHLLIIGSGSRSYHRRLSGIVLREKLATHVTFLGYRKDVFDLVSSLDFFVLPSVKETFGLALLEAMALGIPSAVFSDSGGCLDILGDTGFVVENSQQLSAAFLRIRNDQNLKKTLSEKSRQRAMRFDIVATAQNYRRLYLEI